MHHFRLLKFAMAALLRAALSLGPTGALAQPPPATTSPPATPPPATPAPATPAPAAPAAPATPPAAAQAPAPTPPAVAPVQTADPFGEEITLSPKQVVMVKGTANWDSAFETLIDSFKALQALLDKQGIKAAGNMMIVYTSTDDTRF